MHSLLVTIKTFPISFFDMEIAQYRMVENKAV